ncbi:Flp pilus assembly protein CpaB [Vibrio comitans]|uniref:Flp pilus assembly protein RcpC/CpaB domain-containing protein n=1 Tax=Vibrio comitans NBRC 102076 TaxID=1219078 RepID=A0A4Y3IN19_9VIBR|nr:Flp pilus assembly protein CpaB [Vibrio comitans]GEA60667.1 hypothetical protein VCO01S_18600 [Vibrio comitans NBRC 102076]
MNSRVIFFISFICISIGLFVLFKNVSARTEDNEQQKQDAYVSESVERQLVLWKANRHIERGQQVTKGDFNRIEVNESDAHKIAVFSDVQLLIESDTLANKTIAKDEWVFANFLTNPDDGGYLDLLASEGMILYPLPISTSNLINNYIRSGDFVDIVSVSSPEVNLADQDARISQFRGVTAGTIIRNVKVLAFEQNTVEDDGKSVSKTTISPRMSSKNDSKTIVVLEIEPEFVSKLSLAQRTMHLEMYRSHANSIIPMANMTDVIENYQGIRELRGTESETQMTNVEVY